ncbi:MULTISPECIES: hypothetical protein [unclassified Pseudoalteromonas]|uniref:hypothetical protein n=1 Tax=unclassified Pseudoalteromonas TaxID=194690 RepID=UPI0030155172
MSLITTNALALGCLLSASASAVDWSAQGQLQLSWQRDEGQAAWYQPGWGVTRFGAEESPTNVSRGAVAWRADFDSLWSWHGVAQYVPDPDDKLGITELYLQYRTLPHNNRRWRVRVGGFYPAFSMENPDIGWSSPYTYQYSAINSWIGEEVRVFGGELTFEQPATRRSRGKGWAIHAGAFKGNDPAGTLLAWRGFTLHDRQTVINERIAFAPVAALSALQLAKQAQFVEPFTEVDGRFGYYLGYHQQFSPRNEINLYWYDNNGDPARVNYATGQYAWDTKFISVAWRYKLTKHSHFIMQGMQGNTAMGPSRGVDNDFHSWYAMLTQRLQSWRLSARIERFKVIDKDAWRFDPNASEGSALTLSAKYHFNDNWIVGGEWLYLDTKVANREDFNGQPQQYDNVWRLSAEYRFRL